MANTTKVEQSNIKISVDVFAEAKHKPNFVTKFIHDAKFPNSDYFTLRMKAGDQWGVDGLTIFLDRESIATLADKLFDAMWEYDQTLRKEAEVVAAEIEEAVS